MTKPIRHNADYPLADAEAVLLDPNAITRDDPTVEDERRFVSLGLDVVERVVVVVYTYREEDVRLIFSSARNSERETPI